MKRQHWVAVAVLAVALAAAIIGSAWTGPALSMGNVIALVRIEGAIAAGNSESPLGGGGASSDHLMSVLQDVGEDDRVKAVVLRINSPGGTASASYEIGREVERLRERGKKVVVSMGDVAASGGYWIAAHGDYIMAAPGTITGSIGVIMQAANLEELYKKIGYEEVTIKSGPHKDIGSPGREMTDEERALLQQMVDESYNQFVAVVARGRNLPEAKVRELADGRIFLGSQAKEAGLVDELGNLEDSYRKAAELAGLREGEYTIAEFGKVSPLEQWLGLPTAVSRLASLLAQGPRALLMPDYAPPQAR